MYKIQAYPNAALLNNHRNRLEGYLLRYRIVNWTWSVTWKVLVGACGRGQNNRNTLGLLASAVEEGRVMIHCDGPTAIYSL